MNVAPRLALLGALFAAAPAWAQVDVRMQLRVPQVLPQEQVPVVVTLVNNTGQRIASGQGPGEFIFGFEVRGRDGLAFNPRRERGPMRPDFLPPLAEITFTNDLNRLFDLSGHENVSVVARVDFADRAYFSRKAFLDVLPGVELMRMRGPTPGGTRTYALRLLPRDQRETLFLRIDDEDAGLCYGVFELGHVVRQTPPTMQVDATGLLHVLHQSGPRQFLHSVFSGDGRLVESTYYGASYQSVRLTSNAEGKVTVQGPPASEERVPMARSLPIKPGTR